MLPFTYGGRGSGANSRTYFRTRIAAGADHSLFSQAGLVWAWGKNDKGQLGDTSQTDRLLPSFVMGLKNIKAVSAGAKHSLALQTNGVVWAWGDNKMGQLGVGPNIPFSTKPTLVKTLVEDPTSIDVEKKPSSQNVKTFRTGVGTTGRGTGVLKTPKVVPLDNIIAISAGENHNLALDASGQVWAWGANQDGQLGIGHQGRPDYAVKVLGGGDLGSGVLQNVIAIAAGNGHSLAATSSGKTFAWGVGGDGQLGNSSRHSSSLPSLVIDSQGRSLQGVVCVSAGLSFSMALTSDSRVFTWGDDKANSVINTTAQELNFSWDSYPVDIATGTFHSLVLTAKGKVYAWGQSIHGQAGNGKREIRLKEPVLASTEEVLAIAAGGEHNLSVKIDSSLWAWGKNEERQLGTLPIKNQELKPKKVFRNPQNLLATGSNHSLVIKGGTVWSWGAGGTQLGYRGSLSAKVDIPTRVTRAAPVNSASHDLQDIVAVATGITHSMALQVDGEVLAWGRFTFGQRQRAMLPGLDSNFIAIAAGHLHSIALRANGTVWDWSRNTSMVGAIQYGQNISGLTKIISISANAGYSLALDSDGTVWSWGVGYLGNGKTFQRRQNPKQVLLRENTPLKDIVGLSAGLLHSMAIDKDGNIWTWGNNGSKALGRGGNPLFAGQVTSLRQVIQVSAGLRHSLALLDDGSVWAWGTNAQGQFGDGQVQKTPSEKPNRINTLQEIVAISTNTKHNLALRSNKDVVSWGEDLSGELGRPLAGCRSKQEIAPFS